jgi:hypothetical protein
MAGTTTSTCGSVRLQSLAVVGNAAAARPSRPQPAGGRQHRAPLQLRSGTTAATASVQPPAATKQAEAAPAGAKGAKAGKGLKGSAAPQAASDAVAAAERESLQLLEWPGLCRQVACFAQTPMGAEVALRCALPVGRSRQESEQLLRETAEAQQAQLG